MRWFRVWLARQRVLELESAVDWHANQMRDHQLHHALALQSLRKARAALALVDCPARALRLVVGRKVVR